MKNLVLLFSLVLMAIYLPAQNDTVYIMKSGEAIQKISIKPADVDSIIFYNPAYPRGSFTDERDGRKYRTVKIGEQVWMGEPLKYLPKVSGPWAGSETEAYYYVYGYIGTNVEDAKATDNYKLYGVLYNWPAVMAGASGSNANPSGVRGICPAGWHVPSNAEFKQLADFLGGESIAGAKLKSTGTTYWKAPNTGATNETGFSAVPAGGRNKAGGAFEGMGYAEVWWCTWEVNTWGAHNWGVEYNKTILANSTVYGAYITKAMAYPMRCVKD
jgi:uncharacterized protein (TIGR02145 family)